MTGFFYHERRWAYLQVAGYIVTVLLVQARIPTHQLVPHSLHITFEKAIDRLVLVGSAKVLLRFASETGRGEGGEI